MDFIRQEFQKIIQLSDAEWQALSVCFIREEFKKGDVLLKAHEICNYTGFLQKGLLKFYHIKDGDEKITAFWFPDNLISNYRSFIAEKPSTHYIEAITDGVLWKLYRKDLYALYDTHPTIDRMGRFIAEHLFLMVTERLDQFVADTPEERYEALLKKNSHLLQEIPQYMIASYLGVSPESLSRIRKRMSRKPS